MPPGREEHEQHEGEAEDEHPALGVGGHQALQQDEGGRAEERAAEGAGAADDDHEERFARGGPEERVRRNGPLELGVERARDARHRPRDHEGEQLVAVHGIAHRLHARLVLVDPAQHVAERRAGDAPQEERGEGDEDEKVDVEARGAPDVQPEHGRARHARDPVLGPEEGVLEGHRVEHLGEGQREHDEVHAAHADARSSRSRGRPTPAAAAGSTSAARRPGALASASAAV